MPGFSSMDDIINAATTLGQTFRSDWAKNFLPTTPAVAGEWHCLARGGGNPPNDAIFNVGTNLAFQQVLDTTANAGAMLHGGAVSPAYKFLTGVSGGTAAATSTPGTLMLVDLVGFYRVTSTTTITSQAMSNPLVAYSTFTADASTDTCTHSNNNLLTYTRVQFTTTVTLPAGLSLATDYYIIKVTDTTFKVATSYANAVAGTAVNITDAGTGTHTVSGVLPRYTNGAGVQAFMWANNATPLGAATPNLSLASYTNSAQATGRATPTVLPVGKTACPNGQILYSGTGVGKFGPFMPLQAGDAGIAKVDNVQISVSYVSGEFSLALCKPLVSFPITTLGVLTEKDLINQFPSGVRVYDGAALYWLYNSGAATPINSAFFGHADFIWK